MLNPDIKSKFKHWNFQLVKNSLIYGIGSSLQKFITILLLPIYTNVLSTSEYGIISLLSLTGVALNGFLNLGTGNSMGVLFFKSNDFENRSTIIWSTFLLILINVTAWFFLICFFSEPLSILIFENSEFANLLILSSVGYIFMVLCEPFLSYLRMERNAVQYIFLTVINSLITICISIFLVIYLKLGVLGVVLALVISQMLLLLYSIFYMKRNLVFRISTKYFIPLIRIGFPSIFGIFAYLLIDYSDRYMIQRLLGLDMLGIYSVGYGFGMLILVPINAFSTAWPPFYMAYIKKQEEAKVIFSKVIEYYLIIFGFLIILLFLFSKPLLSIFTSSDYHSSWVVVGIVAASYMFRGCYLIFQAGICFAERFDIISLIDFSGAILNIILNYFLISSYGILGAALATLISYAFISISGLIVGQKFLSVRYDWKKLFIILFFITSISLLIFRLYI